ARRSRDWLNLGVRSDAVDQGVAVRRAPYRSVDVHTDCIFTDRRGDFSVLPARAKGGESGSDDCVTARVVKSARQKNVGEKNKNSIWSSSFFSPTFLSGVLPFFWRPKRCSKPARAYGLASKTRLNGVSVARRKRVNPPLVTTSRMRA